MRDTIKNVLYCGSIILLAALMVVGAFLLVVATPKGVFASTYQSQIQVKYDRLRSIQEPKIVLVGGSNLSFGLDEERLEEATGYPVVNLGLHAGFGHLFNTELIRGNINEGDIVLISYEYDWVYPEKMEYIGWDLVMSGIDHRLDMYRQVPVDKYTEILGYLSTYGMKKLTQKEATGDYSASSFDEKGRMILDRPTTGAIADYHEKADEFGVTSVAGYIPEDAVAYVRGIKEYVEGEGASIYFVAAPVLKDSLICTEEDVRAYEYQVSEIIGIPYISDTLAYLFPMDLMYDTIYHCNNAGEQYRTDLLIQDLQRAGICKN